MIETLEPGGFIPGRPHGLTTSPTIVRICNYSQYQQPPTTSPTKGFDHSLQEEILIQEKESSFSSEKEQPTEEQIKELAQSLKPYWPRVFAFVGVCKKKQLHMGAVFHALLRVQVVRPDNPWAYAQSIIGVESGNYRERDHHNETQKLKKNLI